MSRVDRILVRSHADAPPLEVFRARAVPGRGLAGDRYHAGTGTFSRGGPPGRDLTLIAAEVLEALASEGGPVVSAEESGRNVVTRGVDLNALVGVRFRLGEVECRGDRLCEPCATLEARTRPGVMGVLAGRGGLRADIVAGGELVAGAELVILG